MDYPKRELLEKTLFKEFRKKLSERYGAEDGGADTLVRKLYLAPQEGCIPDEFTSEDLLLDIRAKYYDYFSVVTDALEKDFLGKQGFKEDWFSIWIDPCYEDTTSVVITFVDFAVLTHSSKPWNLHWQSNQEIKQELADLYYRMKKRLLSYIWEGIRYSRTTKTRK